MAFPSPWVSCVTPANIDSSTVWGNPDDCFANNPINLDWFLRPGENSTQACVWFVASSLLWLFELSHMLNSSVRNHSMLALLDGMQRAHLTAVGIFVSHRSIVMWFAATHNVGPSARILRCRRHYFHWIVASASVCNFLWQSLDNGPSKKQTNRTKRNWINILVQEQSKYYVSVIRARIRNFLWNSFAIMDSSFSSSTSFPQWIGSGCIRQ